jgi:CHAT domain-containing protein
LLLERADARRLNHLLASSNDLLMVVGPHTELADQIPILSSRLTNRFTYLDGPQADVAHILRAVENYHWLHFLSHGTYDSEDPMLCGLHVAPDIDSSAPGIDGFLGVEDIAGCHLAADSVVLCACDSANGRIQPGEGLVGLPSAFLVAGASSVVASQWLANTVAATRLMREYYARLPAALETPRNLWNAEALAAAQSSFLTDRPVSNYHDPRYWGSFVLIGDPR